MKNFNTMTPQEKERLRIVLQGVRDQMVAYRTSVERLVRIVGEDRADDAEMMEYFEEVIPEGRPLEIEDVRIFCNEFGTGDD